MMRIFILLSLFFYSFCCWSQVKDDFSDGDFVRNPVWQGSTDKFEVNKALSLRLNDKSKTAGYAWLSTPSSLLRETTWTFYVHLYFNPSANNYAKFYLTSTAEDVTGNTDGYFLLIGGKDDNVSLYRQNGDAATELIKGASKMVGINSPELQIKVYCDADGKWSLYTSLINSAEEPQLEGTAIDASVTSSSHIGLACYYTASRYNAFVFDDILVVSGTDPGKPQQPEEPQEPETPEEPEQPETPVTDTTPPVLLSVYPTDTSSLLFSFDEAIDATGASFRLLLPTEVLSYRLSADRRDVEVVFSTSFVDAERYEVCVEGVKDLAGNVASAAWLNFSYYDADLHSVGRGDIVFNEIMANPGGAAALPEVEYVELYNRTGRPVNLEGWKLHYGPKAYVLNRMYILPGAYLVLCHEKRVDVWAETGVSVQGVASFPELANAGKLMWLEDVRGNMIGWVEYTDRWYGDGFKKKGGFSLECIDADNFSNDAGNWQASMDTGGGTPGRANSVKAPNRDTTRARVDYAYLVSADTLLIQFSKPMDLSTLAEVDNYTVRGGVGAIAKALPLLPTGKSVRLALSEELRVGRELELELMHIKDISGYDLEGDTNLRIGLGQEALPGDILFNELLFNPLPGGSDYVELYNASDKYILLNRLYFSSREEEEGMSEGCILSSLPRVFPPCSYLCFTKDVAAIAAHYLCEASCMIEVTKLPSLPDTKGNILLLTPAAELIDEFTYSDKMHTSLLDNVEGVSLEKVYPTKDSRVAANWLSASSSSGGGTPGRENSQYRAPELATSEGFWLSGKSFSPNDDGHEDELVINYHMPREGAVATIKVFDHTGRFVCRLADNYLLQAEGRFVWNGKEENGRMARLGLYIVYVEAYTGEGEKWTYKLGCAVGR